MSTATVVRDLEWDTAATLYELAPPLRVNGDLVDHVVVSAAQPIDGDHGSLVFASDADGHVGRWDPIARTDSPEHGDALALIGYEVTA